MIDNIINHLSNDVILKGIIKIVGSIKPHSNNDVYLYLTESIIGQQLSSKVAIIIYNRFTSLFDNNYPEPEKVLTVDFDTLKGIGLSRQKIAYLKNAAAFAIERSLQYNDMKTMTDFEIIEYLTRIKGVGRWTAEMILMFPLDRPDIFPVDDLGIQNTMKKFYKIDPECLGRKALAEKLKIIAQKWKPYRSVACKYLWGWTDKK